jgi:hypothetical protein
VSAKDQTYLIWEASGGQKNYSRGVNFKTPSFPSTAQVEARKEKINNKKKFIVVLFVQAAAEKRLLLFLSIPTF